MWKNIFIFLAFVSVCYGQNNFTYLYHKRRPYYDPYYHHLLYGGGLLYYLAFIIIKIKVVFIIGGIITFMVFAGKFFALIKYAELMKTSHHHPKTEKIYIQAPSHGHGGPILSSPPMSYSNFGSPYSSGITVDKLPPNAEIAGGGGHYYDSPPPNVGGGQYYDSPPPNVGGGQFYDSPPPNGGGGQFYNSPPPNVGGGQFYNSPPTHGYARNNEGGFYKYWKLFKEILRKINLTELVFNKMKLKTNDCKRKFVCKADYNAKYIGILSAGLEFLRDEGYDKYRTNNTITSLEKCNQLYPNCKKLNF